jgi:hypothetical protein
MQARRAVLALAIASAVALAVQSPAYSGHTKRPKKAALYSKRSVAKARRYAGRRAGQVSFAVLDNRRQLTGLHTRALYPSASASKAMLLIAYLRKLRSHHLSSGVAAQLRAMITLSDNDAATAIYSVVGGDGLRRVAKAARMKRFRDVGFWANAQISAGDQVRFFLRIDHLVRRNRRHFVRKLLRSIVSYQRWGIPRALARHRGVRVYFKGGWRNDLSHQIALVQKGRRRVAIAILTAGNPSQVYAQQTIEGITRRALRF